MARPLPDHRRSRPARASGASGGARSTNASAPGTTAASLAASGSGAARVGPLRALPSVLIGLGVAPRSAFAGTGVDLRVFENPDNRIAYSDLGRLLSACATAADCDHIGLLVGERFALSDFGPMGYLIRNSANVGDALRELLLHLYRYDRVAVPVVMRPEASIALLAYSIHHHDVPGTRQVLDVAVTIGYRLMRELCGESWKPLLVQFSYGRPRNVAAYRRLFGAAVRFDAEVSGLAFPASWLEHPVAGADPALRELVTRAIQGAAADDPMRFPDEVQCVLHQLLLSGVASADNVARFFGISERTLRQRLHAEGAGLQPLLDQTRRELAQQLLRNTELPLAEIAATLHYADPSVFSRAFRKWTGESPSRWRATRRKATVEIRSHRSDRPL